MRNTFIKALCEQAAKNDKIFLLCGDLGFSVLEQFADRFPDRYLNVGIAEQNMLQIASGLALEGYKVFVYSIGNFPTLRAMEQIRYDVCYHNLDVTVVAVGAGYAYGPLGTSHHTTEDIAMMRSIPNMLVCAPGDPQEAKLVARVLCEEHQGPAYVRINKAGEQSVHTTELSDKNTAIKVAGDSEQPDVLVLTTGAVLGSIVNQARDHLNKYVIYSLPFLDETLIQGLLPIISNVKKIITVEEHQLSGGFGGWVVENINDLYENGKINVYPKIKRIGIPDKFQHFAGTQEYLRQQSGIYL